MTLGQIPARTSMIGYWPETVSDISGNGRNFTNVDSTPSNPAKFTNGPDFGTTGATKAFDYNVGNPMSALKVADITFSWWFKLNNTTAHNATFSNVWGLSTVPTGTTGLRSNVHYTISGANVTYRHVTSLSTTAAAIDYTIVAGTEWHYFTLVKSGTTTLTLYDNGVQVATHTGSGTDVSISSAGARFLTLGNARDNPPKSNQCWGVLDEFIIEERVWSASEIRKYYTQARGMMIA